MKLLSEVKPEAKVAVKRIDGGLEVKRNLEELGISEGTELTVVATEPVHVEGETAPLLRLEAGEKGTVSAIECGKVFEDFFALPGIEKGKEIEFLRHLPDDTLVLKINDRDEISMGEGQASKLMAERGGKNIQVNYLGENEEVESKKWTITAPCYH